MRARSAAGSGELRRMSFVGRESRRASPNVESSQQQAQQKRVSDASTPPLTHKKARTAPVRTSTARCPATLSPLRHVATKADEDCERGAGPQKRRCWVAYYDARFDGLAATKPAEAERFWRPFWGGGLAFGRCLCRLGLSRSKQDANKTEPARDAERPRLL